jgi:DMSO/TMAO reductase YedYZ molybdopterin-dependent catalytic subunit
MTSYVRFVSLMLLALMVVLSLTGLVMIYGTWAPWIFGLHRIAGWMMVALIPWKGIIAYRSLRRRWGRRGQLPDLVASTILTVVVLMIIVLALMWMWQIGPYLGPLGQTLIGWHWILGFLAGPLTLYHAARRRPVATIKGASGRREALRFLGLAAGGIAGWLAGGRLAELRSREAAPRRQLTASRGFGSFSGNAFPVTGEAPMSLDVASWRLAVTGAVTRSLHLAYDEILEMTPEELTAAIDCPNGWYSFQRWRGVPLGHILDDAGVTAGAAGVRLVSTTGYNHTYPLAEARTILLATHVGDEVLAPRHGYPVRAVVPNRRGWFWVKWITRIEVLDSTVEVAAATVAAPRQILRQW